MGLKNFALCLALLCVFCVGRAQAAPDKLRVTSDNFVALNWHIASRVNENQTLDYCADKNSIARLPTQFGGGYGAGGFGGGFPPYSPPISRPLSTNQFEALVRALQLADVPAMADDTGKSQKNQLTLTLTLSDENNADQTFFVVISAEDADADAHRLSDYLAALVLDKGLAESVPGEAATSQQ